MAKNDVIVKVGLEGAKDELTNLSLLQDAINQLSLKKKELYNQQKELNEAIKAGTITEEEAEQQNITLAQSQVELNIELKETKKEYADNEKALRNGIQTQKTNEGSIASMRLELSKAQQEYIGLSKEERENEKIGGVLQQRIKAQSDELKGLEKEIGITSRSVGDYGSAVNGVLPLMGGFGQSIQQVIGQLGQIKTAITSFSTAQKGMATSTKATNSTLKAFRIALISTGIGAIVVALGSLIAAFLSTQRGIDALNKVLAPIKEVFATLFGLLQNAGTKAFDFFKKALDNPKQGLEDLGKAIKEAFITRFEGAVQFLKSSAKLVVASFKVLGLGVKQALAGIPLLGGGIDKEQVKKDLAFAKEEAIQAAKETASALVQATTGMDKAAQISLANTVKEAAERGALINKLQIELEQMNTSLNRRVQENNRLFAEQKSIADDITKTDAERVAAAKKAQDYLQQNVKLQDDVLSKEIQIAKLKTEANDTTREELKEIEDLEAQRDAIRYEATQKSIELRNKENSIRQQAIAKQKKAIEDQRKAEEKAEKERLDAIKKDEKERIEAETKVLNERIKTLEQTRKLETLQIEETAEMKYQKDKELLEKTGELKVELAKISGQNVNEVEVQNLIDLETRKLEEKQRLDELAIEQEKQKEERIKEFKEAGFTAANDLSQAFFDNQNRRINDNQKREIDALNLKKQAGIISQQEYEAARLEIDKKAFEAQKRADRSRAIINGALAITKVLSTTAFPASLAASALVGLKTGIEIAKISSQKFSRGGLLKGASHENGGIPINVSGNMVEAEGGEVIINKNSSKKHLPLLSAINQDGGGVPLARKGMRIPSAKGLLRFANGGALPNSTNPSSNLASIDDVASLITQTVGALKVVNVSSETADVASRVQQIQDSARF